MRVLMMTVVLSSKRRWICTTQLSIFNRWYVLDQQNYMFQPKRGHHQVCPKWAIIEVHIIYVYYICTSLIDNFGQPDDCLYLGEKCSFVDPIHNTYYTYTLLLLLSVGLPVANAPDVLQPCGLLYYPWRSNSHHQSSLQEILAVRGGAKPYHF